MSPDLINQTTRFIQLFRSFTCTALLYPHLTFTLYVPFQFPLNYQMAIFLPCKVSLLLLP